jgi:phage tail tape-measure protein
MPPDQFGFLEGTKTLSGTIDSTRESAKQLTKSIEGIRQDGTDVAQQRAEERRRAAREAEIKKQLEVYGKIKAIKMVSK